MIKHMSYTEEYKLMKEYLDARNMILKNYPIKTEKA